ncbi:MAG: VIT1/CCC1 family protein [Rhizomicrobium sp.]
MGTNTEAARFRSNLQDELDSAHLYRALALAEKDPQKSDVYRKLATVEEQHAGLWRDKLTALNLSANVQPGLRARLLAGLARRFGPGFVLPTVNALEKSGGTGYDSQPDAVAAGLPAAERSHARVMDALTEMSPGQTGSTIASMEGKHRGMGGNALRAAVLGANDGLVSNLSLVMGIFGGVTAAAGSERVVLLTGLAGLVAGACSMAMGEWLSVNSARELYSNQAAKEAEELQQSPDEEREELALIYQAKGLSEADANALATKLMANEDTALDTLLREELGLDPTELGGSPWAAAGWSFCLFSGGAILPVLPFFFLSGGRAAIGSLVLSMLGLAAIGVGTSLFTGRTALFSACRQIAIGLLAAAITYGVGALAGVSIGG